MTYFRRFFLMIQFLTTIPFPVQLKIKEEDFGKGLIFAPVVGLILGGIMAWVHYGLDLLFPQAVCAVFTIILYIVLTGGIHLDGLGDTFDGIFSNRSKERMLEIMKDSRVGTNAVLAIAGVLLLNASLLASINGMNMFKVILLMPVAGRIGSLISTGASTYARSGEGFGKSFIDYCGAREILLGIPIYGLIFFLAAGMTGLALAAIMTVSAYVMVKLFSLPIGGATGDILGAVCELNQTVFLIAAYIFLALGFNI